ncbi:MAG: PA14 domain-containing protein [Phycisphaerales bacterium]
MTRVTRRDSATVGFSILLAACAALFAGRAFAGQGGGFTASGLTGQYFANADATGTPAFTRQDVRVDFDWGEHGTAGGSLTPMFRDFPREQFAIRWEGRIIPRFSETYTFIVTADHGARLTLQAADDAQPRALIDGSQSGKTSSTPVELKAGQSYRIVLEYRHANGAAMCRLQWSSANTGVEVIEPVREQGINAASWKSEVWADAARTARWNKVEVDGDNWPLGDGELLVREGCTEVQGAYLLQFRGRAQVKLHLVGGGFIVDGKNIGPVLAKGVGYDEKTNTTAALFHVAASDHLYYLLFSQTSRDGKDGAVTGVTDVHVYRPIESGSDQVEPLGSVVSTSIRRAFSHYTVIRWLDGANQKQTGKWNDRTRPDNMRFTSGNVYGENNGGECWEDLVMLANETGKDLYVCTPVEADEDYLRKLALLLKFGSDGREPYTSAQEHPAYPPLNPNLRVYVEIGNEIWNWAFGSTKNANTIATNLIKQNTPETKIFNYDGKGNYRTWHAWRTVVASDVFRSVFGDPAMNGRDGRIRVVIEYQYNNSQGTAFNAFNFIDGYYNNGTGDHVPNPHPVNYYVWGAGGATYFGVGNPHGLQNEIQFKDGGFEQPVLDDYSRQQPAAGAAWQFTGEAGIYRGPTYAVTDFTPGKVQPVQPNAAVGMRFRVGDKPVYLTSLGGWRDQSNTPVKLVLIRVSDRAVIAAGTLEPLRGWMRWEGLYDAKSAAVGTDPIRLEPGVEYDLLAWPQNQVATLHNEATTVTTGKGIDILGPVQAPVNKDATDPSQWVCGFTANPGHAFGPVDLSYIFTPQPGHIDWPQPRIGSQAAYLAGVGEIKQTVRFPKAGDYALVFRTSFPPPKGWPGALPFSIFCDGQCINPFSQGTDRVRSESAALGGFGRNPADFHEDWGSAVFHITQPGEHVIRLVGQKPSRPDLVILFDDLRITSVDALVDSGFGAGQAQGQVVENKYADQLKTQARFAQAFGLHVVAYEAGWSVGGDFGAMPIQAYAKLRDPRVTRMNNLAERMFDASGGELNVWGVYAYWADYDVAHAADYPLMKSIIELADEPPVPANNGLPLPAQLTRENAVQWQWGGVSDQLPNRGDWICWVVSTPTPTDCRLQLKTSGEGRYDLFIDGAVALSSQAAGGETQVVVRLSPGSHGVLLRSAGGGVLKVAGIQADPR